MRAGADCSVHRVLTVKEVGHADVQQVDIQRTDVVMVDKVLGLNSDDEGACSISEHSSSGNVTGRDLPG